MALSALIACVDPPSDSTPEGPGHASAAGDTVTPQIAERSPRGIVPWNDGPQILAAGTPSLVYYGGRVVSNMRVVQVLWGTGSYLSNVTSTATPSMATFYQQSLNSNFVSWLDHDYQTVTPSPRSGTAQTNQHIGAGTFVSQVTITPSVTGTNITDTQIQSEIAAQINAGNLPAPTNDAAGNNNTYYAIYFPHGISIRQGTSRSCQAGGFCAYHGTVANVGGHEIYYGVHPDMQAGSGCDTGCGNAGSTFGNQTSVASHEMVETITDAEVGLASVVGPPLAWYDTTNGEIGDICNANQGTFVGGDGITYTIQKEWSNSQGACIASMATNDFSISASPTSGSVTAGGSTSSTISTATTSGSAQTVTLAVSGAPTGVTATLSPTSVTSGGSSTLSISTTSSAAPGLYTLTVTGTAASGSHTATFALTIKSDFSISASPSSGSVTAGGSTSSTISTATTAGTAQTVSLTVSGAPAGVTATLSPTPVTSGSSSTLSISTTTAVAAGTYTLTVTGTAPSGSHSTTFALTVTSDFSIAASPTGGSVTAGGSTGSTISTATTAGSAQTVSLAVSGAPAGVTASLSPTSVTSGGSSTLSISTTTAVAAGTYVLTVTGTAPSGSHSTTFALTVTSDFSIAAVPASGSVTAGGSTGSTIATGIIAGSAETVALAVSGLPSGVTASLSPTSVASGGSSNLTINTTTAVPAGTYVLVVTGTASSGSHVTSFTLTVTSDFSIAAVPASGDVTAGLSTSSTINTAITAGSAENIALAVSGAPAGVTASLSPTSVTSGGSSTLSIATTSATVPGTYTLTITGTASSGSQATTYALTVDAIVQTGLVITPATNSITVGGSKQLHANETFSDGSTLDVTTTAKWTSSNTSVATVGTTGVLRAVAPGTVTITATKNGFTGTASVTVITPVLVSITLSPVAPWIVRGSTQAFTATGKYSNGSTQDLTSTATWTSATTTVATMSGNVASGVGVGASKITATVGTISGFTTLNVTATPLVSIALTPATVSAPAGYKVQYSATGTFADGSKRNVSSGVTWASSTPSVATISNTAGTRGLATITGLGTTTISATLDGVTGTATANGTNATLASIALTPSSLTVAAGAKLPLRATATFSDSSTLDISTQVTWSSNNTAVATVGSTGMVLGVAPGSATVTAARSGITGTSAITVP